MHTIEGLAAMPTSCEYRLESLELGKNIHDDSAQSAQLNSFNVMFHNQRTFPPASSGFGERAWRAGAMAGAELVHSFPDFLADFLRGAQDERTYSPSDGPSSSAVRSTDMRCGRDGEGRRRGRTGWSGGLIRRLDGPSPRWSGKERKENNHSCRSNYKCC